MNSNERNEMNNRRLRETVANAAISTLAQGEEYENLAYTAFEFGYIFTIEDHGLEALFKVTTDKGTYYFAAQKQSIMRLNINEEFFKATTSQFLELRNNVECEEEPADTARRERSISVLEQKAFRIYRNYM